MKMIELLKEQKEQLVSYLKSKIIAEDWHAVGDAACDIREINAKLMILESQKEGDKKR